MKEFTKKIKEDKEFAQEFADYMKAEADSKVKEATKEFGSKLDEIITDAAKAFLEKKGMTYAEDKDMQAEINKVTAGIGEQLNDLVMKQVKGMMILDKGKVKA